MQDMKERFGAMPTGSQVIVIDGVNYTVVSHYTGGKDIDHVIRALAEKQATAEICHVLCGIIEAHTDQAALT